MSLAAACDFAARLDPRISVLVRAGRPVFYFISRAGYTVEAHDGATIKAALRDHDLNA